MKNGIVILTVFVSAAIGLFVFLDGFGKSSVTYKNISNAENTTQKTSVKDTDQKPAVSHVATPDTLRAVYLTMWSAGSKDKLDQILDIFDKTELNSVVIDVKGSGGELAFDNIPNLKENLPTSIKIKVPSLD